MKIQKIHIGGWFQRTTLHLTEVWDFLQHGKSGAGLPQDEIDAFKQALALEKVTRETGLLEYIYVQTNPNTDISYRIYEDGLIILEKESSALQDDFEKIKDYYDNRLGKSLSFLFSKGAPVPKELANIKTILPYILTTADAGKEDVEKIFREANESIYSTFSTENVEVYRSPGLILINNLTDENLARGVIESEIFFREFKSQLHRYVAIHRSLWEKIREIKERGQINGTDIDTLRNELALYSKTINLIGSRIDQMPAYVRTRQKVTDLQNTDVSLQSIFQLKFETLLDTHDYVKHLWGMTKNYLTDAIQIFTELQAKSTKNTISSLQLVTTIGVVAGILGYLGKDTLPEFTSIGLVYFAMLMAMTWIINEIISRYYKSRKYDIEGKEIERDIK